MVVNVLGLGLMGTQIAALFSALGWDVVVWDRQMSDEKIAGCARATKLLARRITSAGSPAGHLSYVDDIGRLSSVLTVEVLAEELGIKQDAIAALPYDVSAAGLYTNSSSYCPREIHASAGGLHFFNPIHLFPVVEHVTAPAPTDGHQAAVGLLATHGFDVVEVRSNRGYIGNYLLFHQISLALKLVEVHGYAPETVDRIMKPLGQATSLFSIVDLVGVDVTKAILTNLKAEDQGLYVSGLLDTAITRGILGRKNGTRFVEVLHG